MKIHQFALLLTVPLALAACGQNFPAPDAATSPAPAGDTLVVTEGVAAPASAALVRPLSDLSTSSYVTGGRTTTISVDGCADSVAGPIQATLRVSGPQRYDANLSYYTNFVLTNGSFVPTGNKTTVLVANRNNDTAVQEIPVDLYFHTGAADAAEITTARVQSLTLEPVVTSLSPQQTRTWTGNNNSNASLSTSGLSLSVSFTVAACEEEDPVVTLPPVVDVNTPPVLHFPTITDVQATGPTTPVSFTVTASDAEDGASLTPSCTPQSGDAFAVGTHTVQCSVTDNGKGTAAAITVSDSFSFNVIDTLGPVVTLPAGNSSTSPAQLAATGIGGATLAVTGLNTNTVGFAGVSLSAVDAGAVAPVSEPSKFTSCNPGDGVPLALGSLTAVTCTAQDARANATTSGAVYVKVGFASTRTGLLSPIKYDPQTGAAATFVKAGSTLPVKFLPPFYTNNVAAVDLAEGLKFTLKATGGADIPVTDPDAVIVEVYSAGSTTWRYDATCGCYIYNLKTPKLPAAGWSEGEYTVDVSYAGLTVAAGSFNLRK